MNSLEVVGGSASGAEIANCSKSVSLSAGINYLSIVATDGSASAFQSTINITVTYIPFVTDTDGDNLDDTFELAIGTDPGLKDTDDDGLNDDEELGFDSDGSFYNPATDTNPSVADTDGDGFKDGEEVLAGTDPLDKGSYSI